MLQKNKQKNSAYFTKVGAQEERIRKPVKAYKRKIYIVCSDISIITHKGFHEKCCGTL